ncbi:uncharacterized protein LOC112270638 [Brachypodium distachyon]|uniref:uncharacterized protein LOC112270638 n=1 Tax=Brachypodium distachyon TaxID=15368 RepID=UPI000D0CC0A9|nr:uncharacterized protein LOC112270638 [Brachypodium distachyon]|eukprot:XP_024314270.1 uncharacterized protein LOC112270638 [Brachypodium distachyon]
MPPRTLEQNIAISCRGFSLHFRSSVPHPQHSRSGGATPSTAPVLEARDPTLRRAFMPPFPTSAATAGGGGVDFSTGSAATAALPSSSRKKSWCAGEDALLRQVGGVASLHSPSTAARNGVAKEIKS